MMYTYMFCATLCQTPLQAMCLADPERRLDGQHIPY